MPWMQASNTPKKAAVPHTTDAFVRARNASQTQQSAIPVLSSQPHCFVEQAFLATPACEIRREGHIDESTNPGTILQDSSISAAAPPFSASSRASSRGPMTGAGPAVICSSHALVLWLCCSVYPAHPSLLMRLPLVREGRTNEPSKSFARHDIEVAQGPTPIASHHVTENASRGCPDLRR